MLCIWYLPDILGPGRYYRSTWSLWGAHQKQRRAQHAKGQPGGLDFNDPGLWRDHPRLSLTYGEDRESA